MKLADLSSYFEAYATRHVLLNHDAADKKKQAFYCVQTDQNLNEFVRSCSMDLFIALMPYEKAMNKTNAQNYEWNKHIAFVVLKKVSGKEQPNIIAAQSLCEQIGDDFCTRFINDRHVLIDSIEDGSFHAVPVGPLGENAYGYMYMFTLLDYFDQRVDASRWSS